MQHDELKNFNVLSLAFGQVNFFFVGNLKFSNVLFSAKKSPSNLKKLRQLD